MRGRREQWEGLGIVLLVLVVYAGSLDNSFHFDDDHAIVKNPHLQSLTSIPRSFVDAGTFSGEPQYGLMYRPMLVSSLVINHAISGLAPWSYHLLNVLLHAAVCLVVLALLRRWQPSLAGQAVAVVALLAVHPINSQIVNYISARAGILAVLGVLGACLVAEVGRHSTRSIGTLILHLGALLSKSTAIVLVPLLALRAAGDRSTRRWWPPLVAVVVSSVLYLLAATATRFLGPSLSQLVRPLDVQVKTQVKAIVYYLWLLVIPAHLSVIHDFHVAWEPTLAVLAATGVLLSVLVLALGAWLRCQHAAGFGVLGFLAGLGVTFLMPLHVIISEHRLYLSGVGLALFGLCIVGSRPPKAGRPIWAVALILLTAMTIGRTTIWQNEATLWSAALRQAPGSSRVHANVGSAHYRAG